MARRGDWLGSFSMEREFLPPGFRFHPTDFELLEYYLKRKNMGTPFDFEAISELDLYKFPPWDLPERSHFKSQDPEWYFFCPRNRKHASSSRINRANEAGYWKVSGRDRPILHNKQVLGMKKILVFYIGRAPRGDRTNWVMHEYRLDNEDLGTGFIQKDEYVLCRVFQKGSSVPRESEQHGKAVTEQEDPLTETVPSMNDYQIYQDLEDLIASDDLNIDDDQSFSNSHGAQFVPNQIWLQENENPFTGLNNFQSDNNNFIAEENGAETIPVNDFSACYNNYCDPTLDDGVLQPALMVTGEALMQEGPFEFDDHFDVFPKENIAWGGTTSNELKQGPYGFNDHSNVIQKGETTYNANIASSYSSAMTLWEPSRPTEDLSALETGNQQKPSSSMLQSLWDSIPARSASAVEHPVDSNEAMSSRSSKIPPITSRQKHNLPRRDLRCGPPQHGCGWGFVFGLALVSVAMWLVLVVVAAKLGWWFWKLMILS